LEYINSIIEEKWGDHNSIRVNLIRIKEHFDNDDFPLELAKELGIDYPSETKEQLEFKTATWLLHTKYDIPLRKDQLNQAYADIRKNHRQSADVTWQDKYGLFIMPDCTGYVLDLLHKNKNVLLVGPKGCGKTELGKIIYSEIFNVPYTTIDITPKTTRFDLEGLPTVQAYQYCSDCGSNLLERKKNGIHCTECGAINKISITEEKTWDDGMLTRACRSGQSLLLNELDAAGEDLATGFMQLFQDHSYTVIQTGEKIDCEKTNILGTANTIGTGSDQMYNRQVQDKALMSRLIPIYMNYPPKDKEKEILMSLNKDISKNLADKVIELATQTRKAYMEGHITDVISTRELVHFAEMYNSNPRWDEIATLKICLCNRYEKEEMSIVMTQISKIFSIENIEKMAF